MQFQKIQKKLEFPPYTVLARKFTVKKNGFYGIYGTARWSPFLQCRRMHHILPMLQTQQGVNTKNRKATRIRDF